MTRRSATTEALIEEMIGMQMTLYEIAITLECTVGDVIDHLGHSRGYVASPPPARSARQADVAG